MPQTPTPRHRFETLRTHLSTSAIHTELNLVIIDTAPGIDKARALEGALSKIGIEATDAVAFGDGQNDCSMLKWAGIGVAMANAVDETKAAAQMVTLSNNEDGIAEALDKLLD